MGASFINIFLVFLKIGCLLLGGGYVIVPLLQSELVDKRKWITKEELIDFYALGQCVPGLIAANTAIFIGYKLRGKTGALVTLLGLTIPPFLTIILLASILTELAKSTIMNNIFWGVNIAIIILIFLTVKEVWNTSIVDKFTLFVFILMFILSIIGVSPALLIIFSAVLGIVWKKRKEGRR